MKSIYFKSFLLTACLMFISFLLLGTSFLFMGRSFISSEKRSTLYSNTDTLMRTVSAFAKDDSLADLDLRMLLSTVARVTGNHIFISDENGLIVSCSDDSTSCGHIGFQLDDGVMQALQTSDHFDKLTTLGGLYKSEYYVIAMPIHAGASSARVAGYLFAAADGSFINEIWDSFLYVFFAISMLILGIAIIISYIYSRRQTRPLNEMAAAASKFAHGDFSVRVSDCGRDDEIGQLTAAFNAMAESLEKAEVKRNEFISNVSHELKTPMTSISGFADGILDGTIPPQMQNKYLTVISSETKRLSRLVRNMLELSRLQSGNKEQLMQRRFDIGELLRRSLLSMISKIDDKHLDVDAQIPEESMMVLGSEDAITQVVYNLLDNAIKFALPGSQLGLSLWKSSGKAYVSVRDTGETIPPDDLPLIFDRFHKSDRSRSLDRDGLGLGLYIVKTILNNHGEDISVSSRDGVTEFVFSLTLEKVK